MLTVAVSAMLNMSENDNKFKQSIQDHTVLSTLDSRLPSAIICSLKMHTKTSLV